MSVVESDGRRAGRCARNCRLSLAIEWPTPGRFVAPMDRCGAVTPPIQVSSDELRHRPVVLPLQEGRNPS